MANPATRILTVVILSALLVAGVWYLNRPQPIEVLVETVAFGSVEEAVANTRAGTVEACRRAMLSPGIGGQLERLNIQKGDHVEQGTLLLELWNKDLRAQIALYEAESTAAQATARSACLQADVARRESHRLQRLVTSGAVSEDTLDKAVTEAAAHQAQCESANAKSRVAVAQADVARAQLERTQLVAPFAGVVADINGELNEYVTPSPPGIATPPAVDLIDTRCFYMSAPIDEVDAPRISLGQHARVTLDAFGERRFPGTVRRIAAYVLDLEKQARTVEVEVEFTNPDDIRQLLAGYSADVEIILDVRKETLRIPSEALLEGGRVLVLLPDEERLEARKVTIGIANWDHTEILSGLQRGEQVVTSIDREGVEGGAYARVEKASQP